MRKILLMLCMLSLTFCTHYPFGENPTLSSQGCGLQAIFFLLCAPVACCLYLSELEEKRQQENHVRQHNDHHHWQSQKNVELQTIIVRKSLEKQKK